MDMREYVKERTELAQTYAEDGAYRSAARILKETADRVQAHADRIEPATYRVDWIDPEDRNRNTVLVRHHNTDLKAARATARKMSKATGSAYIIRSLGGRDVGQIGYTNGRADHRAWAA